MHIVLLFPILIISNIISAKVFKRKNPCEKNGLITAKISTILNVISILFLFIGILSQPLFAPYTLQEARIEILILSTHTVATLLSIYAFLMAFSTKIKIFVFQNKRHLKKLSWIIFILYILIIISGSNILFHYHHVNLSQRIAPKAFHINKVIYGYNTYTGFGGPGDWETGLNIYHLPVDISRKTRLRGIDFLNELRIEKNCKSWRNTPVLNDDGTPSGFDFLSVLGDSYEYDRAIKEAGNPTEIVKKVSKRITSKGSFYCRTRSNTLLISPEDKWLVLYY